MTYEQALDYIHSLMRFGIKPGLGRVRALCELLGNPQDKLRIIHVAGTNGKGSTCTMLAEICRAAGMKTGLYISPYVIDFRERMQVLTPSVITCGDANSPKGEPNMISHEDLARLTAHCKALAETIEEPITEFEFITALAFAWFAEQNCDVVVLEVGLGGRLDATNVIPPPWVSVITKIAYDHMDVLGDTLTLIAGEKCGIIKPSSPVVTTCEQGEEALEVIRKIAQERGCTLTEARMNDCEILESGITGSRAKLAGLDVHVPMLGEHMCRNALTAVITARVLNLPDEAIVAGIAAARIPARMEILSAEPLVILDGGHNPDCATALANALTQHLPGQKITAVCGMMADKDVAAYLQLLRPHVGRLITVRPDNPRAISADELAAQARALGYDDVQPVESLEAALQQAQHPLLICGSFYLAGDVRSRFL
ncbi:MAG: bifunctional folylpolyglutamate synthase/dihydrofolate synthase [Oscillospiraceae bacterium]|nr:bifunctional folylpolyglutamate synthase/dihydrofolate synthase [Oscillospiraceae bacterium]